MAKKTNTALRTAAVSILYLATAALAIYLFNLFINRPRFVHYPAFGIPIPVNYPIHGIDISHHQATIDWADVKKMRDKNIKIGFTYIKATEGISNVDDCYRKNWFRAKEAGLPRGAYHFFIASKSGRAQAESFIETVTLEKGDLPPVLDIEQTNGASVTDIQERTRDFLVAIEKQYKVKPIIYTNVDFYNNFLTGKFDEYPLWVAHYLVKDKPSIDRKWVFWQHSKTGRVNGIDAPVDFNAFNGDSSDFNKLLIK